MIHVPVQKASCLALECGKGVRMIRDLRQQLLKKTHTETPSPCFTGSRTSIWKSERLVEGSCKTLCFLKEIRHARSASKTQHGLEHQQQPVVSCLHFLHLRLSAASWHKIQEALTHFSWVRLSASLSCLLRHSHSS